MGLDRHQRAMIVAPSRASNQTAVAAAPVLRVSVSVPARLHLGFVDLNGDRGRRFGSLGIAIEQPRTRLTLTRGDGLAVHGPDAERARAHLERLRRHYRRDDGLRLEVEAAIPDHVGLGSGTQLTLATAIALTRLLGIPSEPRALAKLLDRGARSSIGIASFEQGGVILDGGRGERDEPPPVISRLPFPERWRILLIFDRGRLGLHGAAERAAFHNLPPFPAATAAALCLLMLMTALPALAEHDLPRFGAAVAELQRVTGDYFAPAQDGRRFVSEGVAEVLAWLASEGIIGLGQSSWGPTGFALIGSDAEAQRLYDAALRRWAGTSPLAFAVTRGRNRGGTVDIEPPAA